MHVCARACVHSGFEACLRRFAGPHAEDLHCVCVALRVFADFRRAASRGEAGSAQGDPEEYLYRPE
eukprot:797639-Lingulodinium_polyedra.AAC.1